MLIANIPKIPILSIQPVISLDEQDCVLDSERYLLSVRTDMKYQQQGFFSKFLMGGGTQNFRSPSVPDGDEVGWGGGTCKKNPTEAKTAHLMQN